MIHLHIGRPKTGSSSIQMFLERIAPVVGADRHVVDRRDWRVAVGLKPHKGEPMSTLEEFRALFQASPDATFIVSSEYAFGITDQELLSRIKAAMSGHAVKVLVYLRDHPSLMVSLYNQASKKGTTVSDFDAFFSQRSSRLPAAPNLSAWAAVFGWENITVRLVRDVLVDYAEAAGLSDMLTSVDREMRYNQRIPWTLLELRRFGFAQALAAPGKRKKGIQYRAARRVLDYMGVNCSGEGLNLEGTVQYLTRAQWRALRDSYNEELAFIEAHTGDVLPPFTEDEPEERPFLPSIETIPRPLASRVAEIVARFPSENDVERHIADRLRKALAG